MIVGFAADDRADRVIGTDGSGTPDQAPALNGYSYTYRNG